MSIKRITAVWDSSKTTGNNRLLMLALADSANDVGYCWPGYDELQRKMACKSRGSVTNAIKHQEAIGELFVDHRQQRGNRYLVLVGLTDDQIKTGLITHFEMDRADAEKTLVVITENLNKSKKQTNAKSPKFRPQKVRNLDRISPNFRPDPSLTVNEPSNITEPPAAVGGDEELESPKPDESTTPDPPAKPKLPHVAVIDGYLAGLEQVGRRPIVKNPYARWGDIGGAIAAEPYTEQQVHDCVRWVYSDENPNDYWKNIDKGIPLENVAEIINKWASDHKPAEELVLKDGVWLDPKFDQRFAGLDVIEANELRDKILLEQLEKTFGGAK